MTVLVSSDLTNATKLINQKATEQMELCNNIKSQIDNFVNSGSGELIGQGYNAARDKYSAYSMLYEKEKALLLNAQACFQDANNSLLHNMSPYTVLDDAYIYEVKVQLALAERYLEWLSAQCGLFGLGGRTRAEKYSIDISAYQNIVNQLKLELNKLENIPNYVTTANGYLDPLKSDIAALNTIVDSIKASTFS